MKQHKILVYTSLYPSPWAPAHGIFVQELTRHIVPRCRSLSLVVPVDGRQRLLSMVQQGHPSDPAPTAPPLPMDTPLFWTFPGLFKPWDGRLLHYWTRRTMAGHRSHTDILHVHYAYPEAFAACQFARQWGVPLVITVHGSDINVIAQDPARRPLIAETLKKADAVVAVSRNLKEKVRALTGRNDGIFHIPNGIDAARFYPGSQDRARKSLGIAPQKKVIVFAGRLEPVKGVDRLIRALSLMDKETFLVIAGSGSLKSSLDRLTHDLGLTSQVRFCGMVPHHRLKTYFQAANLVALASRSEGWPTIILEAMACGAPVVSPAVGGVPEIITDSTLGVLAETAHPDHLATAFQCALDMPWDREHIVRHARCYTWDTIAHAYTDLYHTLMRG